MDDAILITELNDFIFCPVSIYFHKLYGGKDRMIYQSSEQINGTAAHKPVDEGNYSSSKNIITAIDVYSDKYNIIGKIDIYDADKKMLRERKKRVKQLFDGFIFQLYAQYFALTEMGYEVEKLEIYSIDDHKHYPIARPEENLEMLAKFEQLIKDMRDFEIDSYIQDNNLKCEHCIYEPSCDRSFNN